MIKPNDLIHITTKGMAGPYAVVLNIEPDVKDDWWRVHLKVLVGPPAVDHTMLLRTADLDGVVFQAGGRDTKIVKQDITLNTPEPQAITVLDTGNHNVIDFLAEKAKRR